MQGMLPVLSGCVEEERQTEKGTFSSIAFFLPQHSLPLGFSSGSGDSKAAADDFCSDAVSG